MAIDTLAHIRPGTKVWQLSEAWGEPQMVEMVGCGNRTCEVKNAEGRVISVRRAFLAPVVSAAV